MTLDEQSKEMDIISDCWLGLEPLSFPARMRVLAWLRAWAEQEAENDARSLGCLNVAGEAE